MNEKSPSKTSDTQNVQTLVSNTNKKQTPFKIRNPLWFQSYAKRSTPFNVVYHHHSLAANSNFNPNQGVRLKPNRMLYAPTNRACINVNSPYKLDCDQVTRFVSDLRTLRLTDSVTDVVTDSVFEQKEYSSDSPQSAQSATADNTASVSAHSASRSRSSFGAESIMERKIKELDEMSESIATLKRAYTDQMDRKRVKCTKLNTLEQQIGDEFEGIMSEFRMFRVKQAAHGQNLQSKISELHHLSMAIQSEKEMGTKSLEQIRCVLHQQQKEREAVRIAKSMATRCRAKLDEFEKKLTEDRGFFVQNEDLSLDDVDIAEYQKLLKYLTAFGGSIPSGCTELNDDGDGSEQFAVSTVMNMVMEVEDVAIKDVSVGNRRKQELAECILKAKEMRKDHEIISLRAQLTKQQDINRQLVAQNDRLVQQSNEKQVAFICTANGTRLRRTHLYFVCR